MNKKALAKIKPWDLVKVKKNLAIGVGTTYRVVEYPVGGDPDYIKVADKNGTYVFDVDQLTTEGVFSSRRWK